MTFDPTSVYVWCYPRIIVSKSHENTSKYVDTVTFFVKKKPLNQRSLTPRWPLTPHLLKSYVWLYPRITVSKSHENTSKYVDTVNLFAKTWTKGHWPLDDLWPHICWGHMCDFPKDHCVQVPWEYINVCGYSDQFCKLPHTYIHKLHTTYYETQHDRRWMSYKDYIELAQFLRGPLSTSAWGHSVSFSCCYFRGW